MAGRKGRSGKVRDAAHHEAKIRAGMRRWIVHPTKAGNGDASTAAAEVATLSAELKDSPAASGPTMPAPEWLAPMLADVAANRMSSIDLLTRLRSGAEAWRVVQSKTEHDQASGDLIPRDAVAEALAHAIREGIAAFARELSPVIDLVAPERRNEANALVRVAEARALLAAVAE